VHRTLLVKFGHVDFENCERTDRQTDVGRYSSQYFAPFSGRGEVLFAERCALSRRRLNRGSNVSHAHTGCPRSKTFNGVALSIGFKVRELAGVTLRVDYILLVTSLQHDVLGAIAAPYAAQQMLAGVATVANRQQLC